ncbi:MAG: DUF3530 family protein [Gammaproteobacteria bacterium]
MRSACIVILLHLIAQVSMAAGSDGYEQSIADALSQRLDQRELIQLNGGGRQFLGLYHEQTTEKAQGAAIIVHSMGEHPDWPEVIAPLRKKLPDLGWTTLSLQMPVLPPGTALADYGKTLGEGGRRIQSAIQYLKGRKFLNIVIIGYSFGAAVVADFLAASGNRYNNVKAFVGISMQAQEFLNPRLKLLARLENIALPVLDIYGSRDFDNVLRQVDDRRLAGRRKGGRDYQQIMIEGADHYFTGLDEFLVRHIRGWLDKAAPGVRVIVDDEFKEQIKADGIEADETETDEAQGNQREKRGQGPL